MNSSKMQIVALSGFLFLCVSSSIEGKTTVKRGIADFGLSSFGGGWNGISHDISFGFPGAISPQPVPIFVKTIPKSLPPFVPHISPSEIAHAISAAQEASSRVQYLQHRVQAAKDALLEQQHIAKLKEQAAALALQRSEAAAAVQRQASSAAAASVVHAQERLAEAKAMVAEQQKIAAEKEKFAAHVIGKSAKEAAAEIQRTEDTAAKIAALQNSSAQAAFKHVSAAKDASLSATASALAANRNVHGNGHGGHEYHHSPPPKFHPWN